MSTKNDVDVVTFSWTDEYVVIFCDVCINFITKNGRGQPFRWRDLQDQFADKVGKKCHFKILKNKYDAMEKDWRLWKYLKMGETGLGWNSMTGKLDCSDDWWERKLKEKPEAKKFRFKGLSPLVEEKWDHLFGDVVATGEGCVAPSLTIDQEYVDEPISQVEQTQDKEGETQDKDGGTCHDRLGSLDEQEEGFWSGFINEVRGTFTSPQQKTFTNTCGMKPTKGVKRKRRESGGQGTNTKRDEVSIDEVMEIMNRIAIDSDVVVGGDTWCHAMLMFRDPTTREIFFKMPNDDARLSWLKFAKQRDTV
ncbi:hypothetical protein OSB04_011258 [Centaurea solstitialis]|uniref:Myb/SANT-like domain-containing protein n=1 Tax=Centaurea solstitialis TaxID=347529 RepID=A0AA38TAT6_9ASTR|nr:hypothetical protein OSB04_011258 [Centaurea solstitialis]